MTVEERIALIEEKHAALAEHVTNLTIMMEAAERRSEEMDKRMDRLEAFGEKTDQRINRVLDVTLRIGADLSERLRKLEEGKAN